MVRSRGAFLVLVLALPFIGCLDKPDCGEERTVIAKEYYGSGSGLTVPSVTTVTSMQELIYIESKKAASAPFQPAKGSGRLVVASSYGISQERIRQEMEAAGVFDERYDYNVSKAFSAPVDPSQVQRVCHSITKGFYALGAEYPNEKVPDGAIAALHVETSWGSHAVTAGVASAPRPFKQVHGALVDLRTDVDPVPTG